MIGIYGIKNKINDQIYIGQSTEMDRRWITHRAELKSNKHANKHLLRSYKKYGKDNFEFLILERCKKEDLDRLEEKWINSFPKDKLYNQNFYITDLLGERNPFFGKKHSRKSIKKMSDWKKQNFIGEKNPNFGKKWTDEQKIINTLNHPCTKLKEKDVIEIKNLLLEGKLKDEEIANKYGVGRTVVTRISNGTRWSNITGGRVVKKERRGLKNIGRPRSEETKRKISQASTRLKNQKIKRNSSDAMKIKGENI